MLRAICSLLLTSRLTSPSPPSSVHLCVARTGRSFASSCSDTLLEQNSGQQDTHTHRGRRAGAISHSGRRKRERTNPNDPLTVLFHMSAGCVFLSLALFRAAFWLVCERGTAEKRGRRGKAGRKRPRTQSVTSGIMRREDVASGMRMRTTGKKDFAKRGRRSGAEEGEIRERETRKGLTVHGRELDHF